MRYRPEDEMRLQRTVNNFNAKVRRLEKAGKVAPEKISMKEFRKSVTETRQDFNRELNRLTRFSRKNAAKPHTFTEYGITVTHWEAVEVSRQIGINNRKRERIRRETAFVELTSRGKPIIGSDGRPLLHAQMGSPEENAMQNKKVNLNKINSKVAFSKLMKSVFNEAKRKFFPTRDEQWRQNYVTALKKIGMPLLAWRIDTMPISHFKKVMKSDFDTNLAFHYEDEKNEMIRAVLREIWAPENVEMIIKKSKDKE